MWACDSLRSHVAFLTLLIILRRYLFAGLEKVGKFGYFVALPFCTVSIRLIATDFSDTAAVVPSLRRHAVERAQ